VKNVKKKVLVLITVATLALLMATIMVISQVGAFEKPDPKYVTYIEKIAPAAEFATLFDTSHWTPANPIIITEGYVSRLSFVNLTVNGVLYTWPKSFDYNYTYHWEYNNVTGYGLSLIHETFTFKPTVIGNMFESPSTLELLCEEKLSGYTGSFANLETIGSCQLTGTLRFSNVQGTGTSTYGMNSTGGIGVKFLYVKGWPL
jgi:hypothetical protein